MSLKDLFNPRPSAAMLAEQEATLIRQIAEHRSALGAAVLDADEGDAASIKAKQKAAAAVAETERKLAEVQAARIIASQREAEAAAKEKADDFARRWIETEALLGRRSGIAEQIEAEAAKLGELWEELLGIGDTIAATVPAMRADARDALLGFAVEYCLRTSLAKAGIRFASPVTGSTLDQQPGLTDHCRHAAELVLHGRA